MPKDGDNVTVPCEWSVLMDVNPAKIAYLEVQGDIVFDDTRDVTINA